MDREMWWANGSRVKDGFMMNVPTVGHLVVVNSTVEPRSSNISRFAV